MPTKTIAYLRVSTIDQDPEKNKFEILQHANDKGLGKVEWVGNHPQKRTNEK